MPRRNWELLVREWRAWMFDVRGLSAETRRHYEWRIRHAARDLGWRTLVYADTQTLSQWVATLKRTPSTRNTYRAALLCFFTFLEQRRIRPTNPAGPLPNLRAPKRLPRPYEPDQTSRYLAAAHQMPLPAAVLAELGVSAGLRVSEAAGLAWADVGEMSLRIRGKGSKDRIVDLTPSLARTLAAWRPHCPDPQWVFPGGVNGHHRSARYLRRLHHRILDVAGLRTQVRGQDAYHRTRHTFGTDALEASGDLRAVQRLLGHESPETTALYAEVRDKGRRRVVEQLENLRGSRKPDGQRQ